MRSVLGRRVIGVTTPSASCPLNALNIRGRRRLSAGSILRCSSVGGATSLRGSSMQRRRPGIMEESRAIGTDWIARWAPSQRIASLLLHADHRITDQTAACAIGRKSSATPSCHPRRRDGPWSIRSPPTGSISRRGPRRRQFRRVTRAGHRGQRLPAMALDLAGRAREHSTARSQRQERERSSPRWKRCATRTSSKIPAASTPPACIRFRFSAGGAARPHSVREGPPRRIVIGAARETRPRMSPGRRRC